MTTRSSDPVRTVRWRRRALDAGAGAEAAGQ
jgi:hypothetical protein